MINKAQLESYSTALSQKIIAEFYTGNKTDISGKEILTLTPVRQLNLFILKNLFEKWKDEEAKLKSPYFNYESTEVKGALQNLLNKLSENISISKEFFKPLLEKAIYESIFYLLDPLEFIRKRFKSKNNITTDELKTLSRYFHFNKPLFEEILKQAITEGKAEHAFHKLLEYTDKASQNITLESNSAALQEFSSLLKIEFDNIQIIPRVEVPEMSIDIEIPVENNPLHKPEAPAQELAKTPETPVKLAPEEKTVVPPTKEEHIPLTLNDRFKREEERTLLDHHKKITDIRKAISLNQKFLFIRTLFYGSTEDYEKALAMTDHAATKEEAYNSLTLNFRDKYQWTDEKQELHEFFSIIENKYS